MGSVSSTLLFVFFYGIGFSLAYLLIIRPVIGKIRAYLLMRRILRPKIGELDIEIKGYANAIKENNLLPAKPLIEKLLYIKIATRDIATLMFLIKKENDENSRNIISRSLALQLYEFYQDIGNLYNKKFEQDHVTAVSPQMVSLLKSLKKMTATIGISFSQKLKLIRMNVVGHRDFDSVKQFDIINDVDSKEIIGMARTTLFLIYWFNVFHTTYAANCYIKHNMPVPKPIQKFHNRDFKLWGEYEKYRQKKNIGKTNL
jgi:hypothetical protein